MKCDQFTFHMGRKGRPTNHIPLIYLEYRPPNKDPEYYVNTKKGLLRVNSSTEAVNWHRKHKSENNKSSKSKDDQPNDSNSPSLWTLDDELSSLLYRPADDDLLNMEPFSEKQTDLNSKICSDEDIHTCIDMIDPKESKDTKEYVNQKVVFWKEYNKNSQKQDEFMFDLEPLLNIECSEYFNL